jgi:paraquat-inducible protein B
MTANMTPPITAESARSESTPAATPFPKAVVVSSSPQRMVSKLWLLTGLCLIIAIGLVISSQRRYGPQISIHFAEGHGLKAGDTLRYRGIVVGEVTDVALTPKLGGVAVSVILDQKAEALARRGSEFWIERPRVSLSRVSGLETVVGAKYLGVRPAQADSPPAHQFEGIETPPTINETEYSDIAVRFSEGYGLQAGDPVRHRGIMIGEVTKVDLDQDLSGVSVQIRLSGMGRQIAREGSLFWVERPRVSVTEVRGLETLVGGRYVAVSPASADAAPCESFVGLETAPVALVPPGGIEIVLHAPQRWGIDQGVPVTYRGLKVGQVHSVGLSSDGTRIEARATIDAYYRPLIRRNSVFWSTSGIDMNLGFTGLQLTAETLATIAQGGIAFATPEQPGELASSGQRFAYERSVRDEWTTWRPHIDLLASQRPGNGRLPEPQRAVVRWTEKMFGFNRNYDRSGWVLLLDNQRLLGPADLLLPTERPVGDILLEVAGLQQKLDPKQIERSGDVATITLTAAAEGVATWPQQRIRKPTEPEDMLIIIDPQLPPHPLAASNVKPQAAIWEIDATNKMNPTWNGATVVAVKDGQLIGTLIFQQSRSIVVPLH